MSFFYVSHCMRHESFDLITAHDDDNGDDLEVCDDESRLL